jgi:hypothetical protein
VLLVHCFHGGGFPRLLALEVARMQGDRHFVRNEVEVNEAGKREALVVRPGRVRGWSRRNWPFADPDGADGVIPPRLPWRDEPVRYVFRAGEVVRR